jgi:hypothetical protein
VLLGVFSIIPGIVFYGPLILGIPAIICGHVASIRIHKSSSKQGKRAAIVGISLGYFGLVLTALLIILVEPMQARMRVKDEQRKCLFNLSQIALASKVWAADHNDTMPTNFLEMTNELSDPRILICPADPVHHEISAYTNEPFSIPRYIGHKWNATNISYELLTSGMKKSALSNTVIVRCPVHGTELYGDGSVHLVKRPP